MSVSQCADAIQKILERKIEGLMTQNQIIKLAERMADKITRTQERNKRAEVSAIRRRIKEFKRLGIQWDAIPLCDNTESSL